MADGRGCRGESAGRVPCKKTFIDPAEVWRLYTTEKMTKAITRQFGLGTALVNRVLENYERPPKRFKWVTRNAATAQLYVSSVTTI